MGNYLEDRAFTDYIHSHIAMPKVYDPLNWKKVVLNNTLATQIDMQKGIDYVFVQEGNYKTIQERFRESKYQNYSDFTIRYRRDGNLHSERHESEYYKMKAAYFTYGITNCLKDNVLGCTDFIKYAVIDLARVYEKIDTEEIFISDNGRTKCRKIGARIECPVKYNLDNSSSFFPVEISFLVELWGKEIVVAQKGFL